MKNTTTANLKLLYQEAQVCKIPARLTVTGASAYLRHGSKAKPGRGFFTASDSLLKPDELQFVKAVKKRAAELEYMTEEVQMYTGGALLKARDIKYFRYQHLDFGTRARISNVAEVDLTGAYFQAAFSLGIINQELFDRAKNISKKARLVALGALASNKAIFETDESGNESTREEYDEQSANLFFSCALMVDDILQEYSNTGNVLFYWVDAVFVRKENAAHARNFFENMSFPCKEKDISHIFVAQERGVICYRVFWERPDEEARPFRDFKFRKK